MPPDEVLEPWARGAFGHAMVFLIGTLFGSFANVCIARMPPTEEHPRGRSIVTPGSHCMACGKPVRWYDNIPLLSWLILRGRCRDCGASFSPRYLLVEAATGMLFVAAWYFCIVVAFPGEPLSLRTMRFTIYAAFLLVMVVITFIDLDHKLILDKVTYPSIAAFYGLGLLLPERTWWDGLVGAAVGYGLVRLIADGYYYLTGREGMGYGDGKLLAVIGALFGWQAVAAALVVGSVTGSIIGIAVLLVLRARKPPPEGESLRHAELPFGPFLVAGAVVYLFLHPQIAVGLRFLGGGGA
ncbi:MAG TPA: prepilin peptidase [Kofleriaceae bacterium]|nr:prepilin peptidase [Kofleriaceae bacterium]